MGSRVMVGRADELAAVRLLVDAAAAGSGAAVLVTGEAGIGKSRLLDEVAERAAAAGMVVLSGRAVAGGGTYRALAEALLTHLRATRLDEPAELRPYRAALRRLLPGWAGAEEAPSELVVDPVLVLGEGLLELLRAIGGRGGCLLRLEDLHWADDDTVALVEHIAGAVGGAPLLVAVSARDEQRSGAARRLAAAPGMTTLRLRRLDGPQVAALAAQCRGGRPVPDAELTALVEHSEGVPFLVEELVDIPADGVPPTLLGLVDGRLAALTGSGRQVLTAAAVLGGEPEWRLLSVVSAQPEADVVAALRAAVDVGLLTSEDGRLRWRHALTRDAVLAGLLPPETAALARRAAEALVARAGPDDESRAAELFGVAGDPDAAAGLLLRLARRDTARGALRSAETLLARAAGPGIRPDVAVAVTTELVGVHILVGRVDAAIELGESILPGLAGDEHADLCLRLARGAVVAAQWSAAESYVERAGRPDDPRSLVLRADAAFGAGRADAAARLATAGVERAEREGAWGPLCEALGVLGRTALRHDVGTAVAAFRRAAQVAAEHGLTPWRVEALAGLGMAELSEADDSPTLRQARELALDAGMLAQTVSIDIVQADVLIMIDGPRAAAPIAQRATELAARLRLPGLQGATELSMAQWRAAIGDVAGMEALLDAAQRRTPDNPDLAAYAGIGRGVAATLVHDMPRAVQHLDTAMAYLLDHEAAPPLVYSGLWVVARTAVGDRDREARDRFRGHQAMLQHANRAALDYADAIAAGREGRPAEAQARFASADAGLAGMHWWRRLLRLQALEAAVADGWGDPVPALRADLQAHELGDDTGMARTCRDLLRRAGAPTRRGRGRTEVPAALRALGVTSREADVLVLVTQGLTNAQIAQRLFLSTRTVDTHVASLLAKTGAANRGELGSRTVTQTR